MDGDVRVLSLHQPWASLVALGVKTIETRSWSTQYRGHLLIHAAKRRPNFAVMKALIGDNAKAWNAWYSAGLVSDDGETDHMPFGAVVASCRLVNCIPIIADEMLGLFDNDPTEWPEPGVNWCASVSEKQYSRNDVDIWRLVGADHLWARQRTAYDERPFGDYRPGRYAWLLEDVQPTSQRCPRCWGTRKVFGQDPNHPLDMNVALICPCRSGRSDPVPMKGRQGLFRPTWEELRVG